MAKTSAQQTKSQVATVRLLLLTTSLMEGDRVASKQGPQF